MKKNLLKYKRILVVDDEPDVLNVVEELLDVCEVVTATDFQTAKDVLESQYFDMAILDIMGVDGYTLLDIANRRNVLAVMLTAHAFSPEHTVESYKRGAAFYVPKEKLSNIATFLNDVLEAEEKGKSRWVRWLDRFSAYYDEKFGPKWRNIDADFWKNFGES
ncbi:MAG: response regulator [Syntrophorhabdus sp.]